jgi:predicted nucleic acid-binding protein
MADYWDTSCILKLYCRESDSPDHLRLLAASRSPPRSSVLLETELFYAFLRKERQDETGGLSAVRLFKAFRADVEKGRMILLPLGNDVYEESRRIARLCHAHHPPVMLRSLDGLHLATARLSGCDQVFTTDARMKAAAVLLGFQK